MEHLSTIIVGLIVLGLFIFAVKKSKTSNGTCCGCSSCAKGCHTRSKKVDQK